MPDNLNHNNKDNYEDLKNIIKKNNKLAVAFSGGVDSAFLLNVTKNILHENVLAITAVSSIVPKSDLDDAINFTKKFNINHVIIYSNEVNIPEFAINHKDRCYVCKKYRFSLIQDKARELGFLVVADGENLDDQNDYRPGRKAAKELGILSPLKEAGFTKEKIRDFSKIFNLLTWNKPSNSCLAARIPYFQLITEQKLIQIASCENFIRTLGVSGSIRVRHFNETAKIEVENNNIEVLVKNDNRKQILDFFRNEGFKFVTIDLDGYISGSLNNF
ncbi:MAG: ATP-dependent sacrificial sulfur transferase LarE [Desulfobacterales bacterium]|nr:ATP-dependent sacrificial sulfur transferase LarE [Desulfobacterales bacterium]